MDNNNKGAMYSTTDQKIFKQGKVNINGGDENFLVSERMNKDGKKVYELYNRVGFLNINTKKEKETQPDVLGNFTFNTFDFKIAGWKSTSKGGKDYLSVKVNLDTEKENKPSVVHEDVSQEETSDPF